MKLKTKNKELKTDEIDTAAGAWWHSEQHDMEERSKVIVCRGARATEARLLDEVAALRPRSAAELDPPVRIVVPSRSLRLHLLRRLVEAHGAVAGVVVQTLGGVANEIFQRSGVASPVRAAGFDVLTRRFARAEAPLAAELDGLADGYDTILGAIRDLVDAGFTPEHRDGVLEKIADLAGTVPGSNLRRAAALVRVGAKALDAAEAIGAHPRGASSRLAAEVLSGAGTAVLPSRRVLVHGFADLTGVAADLLTEVIATVGGVVFVDRVPDPVRVETDDAGNAFLDRFELRLGGLERELDPSVPDDARVALAEAVDVEAEARWIAETARTLIGSGARPEAIGIVARRLDGLGRPLRRQLGRLGVPFSGVGLRVAGGRLARRADRLAELLRRGGDADVDLWVELADGLEGEVALLLGLRVLSLTRLRDLEPYHPGHPRLVRDVPLPLADGVPAADGDVPVPGRSVRLAPLRITDAADRVRELLAVLDGWPSSASAAAHHAQTQRLLDAMGWATNGAAAEVADALTELADEFPMGMDLDADEWRAALIERLETVGDRPVGGAGGGVQLLSVTEARARTFDHLIVCGLVRGVFPRQVTDDAMLPDRVRWRLATDVLPEMPVKARSADEERYLFAQLVSAAPDVRLSWHLRENGSKMAPSPFAGRLRRTDGCVDVSTVPGLWSPDAEHDGARPAYEHAVCSASGASFDDLGSLLALAVGEGRGAGSTASIPPERVAAARLAIVREVERRPSATDAGPWSGFLGDLELGDRVWVTVLERTATCPLQAHLERRLGIRPLPDPHLGIPDPDQRLLGSVVHDVLERIVTGGRDAERVAFNEALAHEPISVPWPSSDRLEMLLEDAAVRVVFDEGLGGFGLVPLLVARARPVLDVAAEVEWRGGANLDAVLAAEIVGEVGPIAGGPVVAFRADRLDVGPVATDYKTGRPVSTVKTPAIRHGHLVREVQSGRKLQAAAYAMAAPSGVGRGRYLSLKPDIGDAPPDCRVAEAVSDDPELSAAFADAVVTISSARSAGVAFARAVEPKGKPADHCRYCPVAEACRRNDTAFVDQLVELMEGGDEDADEPFGAARRLWWLGVDREGENR